MSVLPPPETQLRSEDGSKLLKYLFVNLSWMWQSGDTMMYGAAVCVVTADWWTAAGIYMIQLSTLLDVDKDGMYFV